MRDDDDDDEDARARGGKGDVEMSCKIFSPSLLKSLSFENFSSVRSVSLSLSRFCRFEIDLGRERERERKRALASGCFLSSS